MIQLTNLSIGYDHVPIISDLNHTFEDNKIYGILAKSGKGKTTLLKTIAGLLRPVSGTVTIDDVIYKNAGKNPVYMMHQRYANFGWLKCLDNVMIAERNKKARDKITAQSILDEVGLGEYSDKYPSQLSGGMQQRLALARTLYIKPKYLLMDEPLSALDDKTRAKMQELIVRIHKETGSTIIMVTHSEEEAHKLCDHIITL